MTMRNLPAGGGVLRHAFDYGDSARMAPIVKMHTLGHDFIPAAIHAGGLRYHGITPTLTGLYDARLVEATAVHQKAAFEAALLFTRAEGLLPAPGSAPAYRAAMETAHAAYAQLASLNPEIASGCPSPIVYTKSAEFGYHKGEAHHDEPPALPPRHRRSR